MKAAAKTHNAGVGAKTLHVKRHALVRLRVIVASKVADVHRKAKAAGTTRIATASGLTASVTKTFVGLVALVRSSIR